jgi:hypothetical protein
MALLVALLLAAPPAEQSRHYRMEIGGVVVGVAELTVRCAKNECTARWESRSRLPREAGGEVKSRVEETSASSELRRMESRPGRERDPSGAIERDVTIAVPLLFAELALSTTADGEQQCLRVFRDRSQGTGDACARRDGDLLEATILGEPERFRAKPGELADWVELPRQHTRFTADPAARVPERAPSLFGAPLSRDRTLDRYCGHDPEPLGGHLPPLALPASGGCQEQTSALLATAKKKGIAGRHVVGVAWDGAAFVWHEWAELETAGGWVAVDPAFQQAPAASPRFSLARYADGDEAGRTAAGRALLRCWNPPAAAQGSEAR